MTSSDKTYRIGIVIGSTRPQCNGKTIATWIHRLVDDSKAANFNYELVDLTAWHLPLFDEPGIPARDQPLHDHTKAWQAKIATLHGFVFVTPQYNWGYPAALKNAIDFLYHEWKGKPAAIISYGGHGGGKAAAQLQQVLQGLRMQTFPLMPGLVLTEGHQSKGVTLEQAKTDFESYVESIQLAVKQVEDALKGR